MAEDTGVSQLETIAIEARKKLLVKNIYDESDTGKYKSTHTRAMSDTKTPINGKGTGVFMDTNKGGGEYDINGSVELPGSGRIKNVAVNTYNNANGYKAPDTTGNKGQVIIN